MSKKVYSLFQLSRSIQNVLKGYANQSYWVKAEILKLNYYPQSGHAYPDLIDKRKESIKAQFRATIWSTNLEHINLKFKKIGEALKDNMQVVVKVSVHYHSIYGLTLNILDVDTNFTLGELARQKQETIKRLKSEDLFTKNKSVRLESIPKTIAVISINSSKGYMDFIDVLENNQNAFQFHYKLFPAVLQGSRAVTTISKQLELISENYPFFDAIAIVRGGGDEVGFSAYDDYKLAKTIAKCPLPVLTGIGHSTNLTVSEMVCYKSFITPTKLAEFLVEQFEIFNFKLNDLTKTIQNISKYNIKHQKYEVGHLAGRFQKQCLGILKFNEMKIIQYQHAINNQSRQILKTNQIAIHNCSDFFKTQVREFIKTEKKVMLTISENMERITRQNILQQKTNLNKSLDFLKFQSKISILLNSKSLDSYHHQIRLQNPKQILERGYSMTRKNGKLIKDSSELKKGDTIETIYFKGKTHSKIENINKDK